MFVVLNDHHGGSLSMFFNFSKFSILGGFGGYFLEIWGNSRSRVFAVYCLFFGSTHAVKWPFL